MKAAVARAAALPAAPIALAIALAFVLGGVILRATGVDPFLAYGEMAKGAVGDGNLPFTIATAVPLVGMALVFAIPLRAGIINLGGEGQLVLGGLTASVVGVYAPLPGPLTMVLAVLAAMVAAGLLGALAAVMENRFGAPLIITSLLLSYPVMSMASYLARYPLNDKGSGVPQMKSVPEGARLPALLGSPTVNAGLLLMVAVVVIAWVIESRTSLGFDIRMTGLNGSFAHYAGVDRNRMKTRVMFAGGAVGGLVGAILVLGAPYRFIDTALTTPQYTWTGLLAALLASGAAIPVALAGTFFAALQVGGLGMERMTLVPNQLTAILQAVIIVFLTARAGIFVNRSRKVGR